MVVDDVYKHELSLVATMDCATHTRYVGDSQVSNAQCMLCAFISTNHTAVNGADVSRLCVCVFDKWPMSITFCEVVG